MFSFTFAIVFAHVFDTSYLYFIAVCNYSYLNAATVALLLCIDVFFPPWIVMAQSRCSVAIIDAVALVRSVGLFDTVAAVDIFASVAIVFMVTVVVVVSCAHLKESASHPFKLSLQLDASVIHGKVCQILVLWVSPFVKPEASS